MLNVTTARGKKREMEGGRRKYSVWGERERERDDYFTDFTFVLTQLLWAFLSPEHVDVNVTPDKRQVMLYQEKALLTLVKVIRCN